MRRSHLPLGLTILATIVLTPMAPAAAETITVTSLQDRGAETLRAAIEQANTEGGGTITFEVAGTIEVQSALPALTAGSTTIDGCTAPGLVVIQAPGASVDRFDGIRIVSAGNVVRCLVLQSFTRDGIAVVGSQAQANLVKLNTVRQAGDDGIGIALGAEATARANLVTGSVNKGILVWNGSAGSLLGNILRDNKDGISITQGSTATIEGNLTENNADNGVAVKASSVQLRGNVVRANRGSVSTSAMPAPPPTSTGTRSTPTIATASGRGPESVRRSPATSSPTMPAPASGWRARPPSCAATTPSSTTRRVTSRSLSSRPGSDTFNLLLARLPELHL